MELSDYLRIPYILEASSFQTADGDWMRRAEYIELPGCVAESTSIVDAIGQVEEKKARVLAEMVRAGKEPPMPRPPLERIDPTDDLLRLGLLDAVLDEGVQR